MSERTVATKLLIKSGDSRSLIGSGDTLIREMGGFGWRAISNVAVDDTWSAVRVRLLKPGEAPIG